ncbi:uncharacterized protein LOC121878113 [Homarus americanus]|uniref:uncharacterized protein LOC121878113 n=1 Tax=Homarus americanus TaxID=6706 RepID=UPI001C4402E0|nr:uncharacterized protein LOC121878113 [Homarus americanus]
MSEGKSAELDQVLITWIKLRVSEVCGEKHSADKDAASAYVDEFAKLVSDEHLSPEQVYNADETALFWRCTPKRTLTTEDAESPSGFKASKDRVTVMCCSNAAGTHKYNCSAHPKADLLVKYNVFVAYLPPNCTSLIQPQDNGIIRSMKYVTNPDAKELSSRINEDVLTEWLDVDDNVPTVHHYTDSEIVDMVKSPERNACTGSDEDESSEENEEDKIARKQEEARAVSTLDNPLPSTSRQVEAVPVAEDVVTVSDKDDNPDSPSAV